MTGPEEKDAVDASQEGAPPAAAAARDGQEVVPGGESVERAADTAGEEKNEGRMATDGASSDQATDADVGSQPAENVEDSGDILSHPADEEGATAKSASNEAGSPSDAAAVNDANAAASQSAADGSDEPSASEGAAPHDDGDASEGTQQQPDVESPRVPETPPPMQAGVDEDVFESASSAPTDSVRGDEIEGFDDDFKALNLERDEPAYLGDFDDLNKDYESFPTSQDVLGGEEDAGMKLARLNAAIEEAEEETQRLSSENLQHQIGLLSMFTARKTTAASSIPEQKKITDSSSTRYIQSLAQWISMVEDRERIASAQEALQFECSQSLHDKQMRADDVCRSYNEFVCEVARQSEYSRTGKLLPSKLVDAMVTQEERKDEEVRNVRLRNIQLRTQVRKLEWRLRAKEELAEGLHLIDFEQLKIENQSLNEKIEERNEELLKLRKKTTSTVQVVTHLKEKLQFVHKENTVLEETLKRLEAKLSSQRDRTQFVKHELTSLKTKNRQFKRQSEIVTSRALLRDVEMQKKRKDELLATVNQLKTLYLSHQKTSRASTTSQAQLQQSAGGL